MAYLVGQTLGGMYTVTRAIASGGMGEIYEAVHTRLAGKRYAVKLLHAAIAQNPEVFLRFRREAEIASSLGHDHIIEVHDFNVLPDGAPYIVMELLLGEDLAARIRRVGPMAPEPVARIVREVASALGAAHAASIVHRDLKPQNIFLCHRMGRDDFVKVLDFGVSKVRDSTSIVTRDQSLLGTPSYMSPEQAQGNVSSIDHRTDVFALGAIVWEMLAGRMAFPGASLPEVITGVLQSDPDPIHSLRPDLSPGVSAVLARALAKDRDRRPASVLAMADELVAALRGPVHASVPVAPTPSAVAAGPVSPPAAQIPSTLSASAGQVTGAPATAPGRSRTGLILGLVLAVGAAAGAGAWMAFAPKEASPAAEAEAVSAPAAPAAPTERPSVQTIATCRWGLRAGDLVEIRLNIEPPGAGAVVTADGVRLTGTRFRSPPCDDPIWIHAEAPGHRPIERSVVPDRPRTVELVFQRAVRAEAEAKPDRRRRRTKERKPAFRRPALAGDEESVVSDDDDLVE